MKPRDSELMQAADRERSDVAVAAGDAQAKVDAIAELGELVRGHVELSADAVPEAKFAAMWRQIDEQTAEPRGVLARIAAWFDRYRGHIITGAVSAGAVAAIAIMTRPSLPGGSISGGVGDPINAQPVQFRPAEVESLDTPGGTGTVFHLTDEDGRSTTVIWVAPEDSVEGL
jgi:hypothetical protein